MPAGADRGELLLWRLEVAIVEVLLIDKIGIERYQQSQLEEDDD